MTIFVKTIEHNTPEHDQTFAFRNKYLYKPWNLDLDAENYYSDLGCDMYGLFRDTQLIGCVQTRQMPNNTFLIKDLIIDFKFRKRGLGSSLLKFAESTLKGEDSKSIQVETLASSLPFFQKHDYRVAGKHKALNKMLLIGLEKPFKNRETLANLPLYSPDQEKPIGVFLQKGENYGILSSIRKNLPKEDIILIELPQINDLWVQFARDLIDSTFKVSLLSPYLESHILNKSNRILGTAQILSRKAIKTSDSSSVLLLASSKLVAQGVYEKRFKEESQNTSLVQLALNYEDEFSQLNSDIYTELLEKLEALKEEKFDTVLIGDLSFIPLSNEIYSYLEGNLEQNLNLISIKTSLIPQLRENLVEKKLTNPSSGRGYLKIYSQDISEAREKLRQAHPTEKNATIESIL